MVTSHMQVVGSLPHIRLAVIQVQASHGVVQQRGAGKMEKVDEVMNCWTVG